MSLSNESPSEAVRNILSKSIKHWAMAPNPDAELAIPELWGKEFSVFMMYFPFKIQGK
jgi:hypothetical protein